MGAALALRDGADVAPGDLEAERGRLLRSGSSDGPAHRPPGPVRARVLRGVSMTIWDAIRVRDRLRHEGRERVEGTIRSLPLWSEYAASWYSVLIAPPQLRS